MMHSTAGQTGVFPARFSCRGTPLRSRRLGRFGRALRVVRHAAGSGQSGNGMAHIVLITHTYDNFRGRKFLIGSLADHWIDAGHGVSVVAGLDNWPDGDIAIMHLDVSVTPEAYTEASRRYPVVVNGAVTDIRKTRVSRHLVKPDDAWTGPVIVKTDLNFSGIPELQAAEQFRRDGKPSDLPPGPIVSTTQPYPILGSVREVPDAVWSNPGLVVERFLPERDARGYWLRIWVFLGDRERCGRYCGSEPVLKAANIGVREPATVPDELRAERERLGFDYGKFDFAIHDGRPILYDANRTPGTPPPSPEIEASNARIAGGIEAMLRKSK
jgi:hypothetical protein